MAGSFSGISTALSSLAAQRQALDVAGQNVANANTVGYTRQRASMTAVEGASVPTLWSGGPSAGNGVRITSITRMGDAFLDARLRTQTSAAGYQAAHADNLGQIESLINEPSDHGLSAQLATYWASWQDVANTPDDLASRQVLLGNAHALVSKISAGYRGVEAQWAGLRTQTDVLVTQVNSAADAVADLNSQIRSVLVSGGNANELIDQRSTLITGLSELAGATTRENADGTVNVLLSGNQLVHGDHTSHIAINGSWQMAAGIGEPPTTLDQVGLTWVDSGRPLTLTGGTIGANVDDLAPAGALAEAAHTWNDVATALATSVNSLHASGQTLQVPPTTGVDFFNLNGSLPAATGLSVAISDPRDVAAANPANGPLDGSWADQIAQIAELTTGPDSVWESAVVNIGVTTAAAVQRNNVLEDARASAENLQLSATSVDLDEESVNMLGYQRAYEAAARVLTTVDEMLDTLINRTGLVGR